MNELMAKIRAVAYPDEARIFYRNAGIFIGFIIFVMGAIGYKYYSSTMQLKSSIRKINKMRQEVQDLLVRFKKVEEESVRINNLLVEEKNFRIKNYFDDIVKKLNLASYQKKEADVSEETLLKQYTEVRLSAQLKQITMKQLCQLLENIEQKQRVYFKELTILQSNPLDLLDVTITCATLRLNSVTSQRG